MATMTIDFHQLIQDSEEFGSDDEHMVSRVFFSLGVDGEKGGDFYADIKQTIGSDFGDSTFEVNAPDHYKGPWNHYAFTRAVEDTGQ
jgi:hypothetical protein